MSRIRQKYDDEFKKNAVKLSYASSKSIKDVAQNLGIDPSLIYKWRRVFTQYGDKTEAALHQESLRKLQIELAELKMENDMLKKAAAYVCHEAEA